MLMSDEKEISVRLKLFRTKGELDKKTKSPPVNLTTIYPLIGRAICYYNCVSIPGGYQGVCEDYTKNDMHLLFQLLYNDCVDISNPWCRITLSSEGVEENLKFDLSNYIIKQLKNKKLEFNDPVLANKKSTINQFIYSGTNLSICKPMRDPGDNNKFQCNPQQQTEWILKFLMKTRPENFEHRGLFFLLTSLINNELVNVSEVLFLLQTKVLYYSRVLWYDRAFYFKLIELCYDKDNRNYLQILSLLKRDPKTPDYNFREEEDSYYLEISAARIYLNLIKRISEDFPLAKAILDPFAFVSDGEKFYSTQLELIKLFYDKDFSQELELYLSLMKLFYVRFPEYQKFIIGHFSYGYGVGTGEDFNTTPAWAIAHYQSEATVVNFLSLLKYMGLSEDKEAKHCRAMLALTGAKKMLSSGFDSFASELARRGYVKAIISMIEKGLIKTDDVHLLVNKKFEVIQYLKSMSDDKPEKIKIFNDMFECKSSVWNTFINSNRDRFSSFKSWNPLEKKTVRVQAEDEYKKLKAQRPSNEAEEESVKSPEDSDKLSFHKLEIS